jgi:hypothetical protein
MPLGEIAGNIFGAALRVVGSMLAELVIELGIKGIGYFVCRQFSRSVNPDGIVVVLVGVAIWFLILLSAYFVYEAISTQIDIDRCLDSGGRFDYQTQECIHSES